MKRTNVSDNRKNQEPSKVLATRKSKTKEELNIALKRVQEMTESLDRQNKDIELLRKSINQCENEMNLLKVELKRKKGINDGLRKRLDEKKAKCKREKEKQFKQEEDLNKEKAHRQPESANRTTSRGSHWVETIATNEHEKFAGKPKRAHENLAEPPKQKATSRTPSKKQTIENLRKPKEKTSGARRAVQEETKKVESLKHENVQKQPALSNRKISIDQNLNQKNSGIHWIETITTDEQEKFVGEQNRTHENLAERKQKAAVRTPSKFPQTDGKNQRMPDLQVSKPKEKSSRATAVQEETKKVQSLKQENVQKQPESSNRKIFNDQNLNQPKSGKHWVETITTNELESVAGKQKEAQECVPELIQKDNFRKPQEEPKTDRRISPSCKHQTTESPPESLPSEKSFRVQRRSYPNSPPSETISKSDTDERLKDLIEEVKRLTNIVNQQQSRPARSRSQRKIPSSNSPEPALKSSHHKHRKEPIVLDFYLPEHNVGDQHAASDRNFSELLAPNQLNGNTLPSRGTPSADEITPLQRQQILAFQAEPKTKLQSSVDDTDEFSLPSIQKSNF